MNDYFCVLPFFGYEYRPQPDSSTHCCLLPKHYKIDDIQKSILAGERSEFCTACWKLEDAGLISDRKLKNSTLDFYWDRDIELIEDEVKQGKYKTLMVKTVTSNTCNSTCVTCNSIFSTAWAPLEKKIGIIPHKPITMTKEDILSNLNFKELISLNFIGGEPLYEKLNFYILESLLEHDNNNCFIQITTNGSVRLSDYQKKLLKKFKNLNFNLSIDGIEKVFEYMRFPLKWNDMTENLEFFKTQTDNVSVSYTISNLNVLYHSDTTDWFKENNLNYNLNTVIGPSHFRPTALPKNVKEKLLEKNSKTKDLAFFIGKEHTVRDDNDFIKMLSIIKQQDQVKGISIKDYLPELYELIF